MIVIDANHTASLQVSVACTTMFVKMDKFESFYRSPVLCIAMPFL